jgi:hypothetical protein
MQVVIEHVVSQTTVEGEDGLSEGLLASLVQSVLQQLEDARRHRDQAQASRRREDAGGPGGLGSSVSVSISVKVVLSDRGSSVDSGKEPAGDDVVADPLTDGFVSVADSLRALVPHSSATLG